MNGAAPVTCPGCQNVFLVPRHVAETVCPECEAQIVWRRCLGTGEAFPVLTTWQTWVHPGCSEVHAVDLTAPIPGGGPDDPDDADEARHRRLSTDDPAGATVLCEVVRLEDALTGRLYLDGAKLGVWPADGARIVVGAVTDIRAATITEHPRHSRSHRAGWRRAREESPDGSRLTLELADTTVQIDANMRPDALRDALRPHLPVG